MISVQEADENIRHYFSFQNQKTIPIEESQGKILAENIFAKRDLPPFHRVAMDGIAINSNMALEYNTTQTFNIEGVQGAGDPQLILGDKQDGCLEVMTGAMLPKNCDAVIPYENILIKEKKATIVTPLTEIRPMLNVHTQGSDLHSGGQILSSGQKINSAVIAILASEGMPFIKVKNAPTIAIVSTGNELVSIHSEPKDYQIYMSNSYALKAELSSFGFTDIETHHIPDDQNTLYEKMFQIIRDNDLILLTGGVSKGKFDYVPQVLSDLKVKNVFHKVSQKPGKPLWFGCGPNGKLIFGLPGNPVSALVNLRRHVIPCLTRETIIKVRLKENIKFNKHMTLFKPVSLEYIKGEYWVTPINGNGSGDYLSLKKSHGFIELPAVDEEFSAGGIYPYYPWGKSCL